MDVSVCRALCVIHAMCTGSKRFAKVLEGKGGGFFSEGQEVGSLYELQLDEGDEQVKEGHWDRGDIWRWDRSVESSAEEEVHSEVHPRQVNYLQLDSQTILPLRYLDLAS